MRIHEASKLLDIPWREIADKTGNDHHMDILTDVQVVELGLSVSDPVIETKSKQTKPKEVKKVSVKKVSVKELRDARGLIGDKDRNFLRMVKLHKNEIPEEYDRIKHLIERYL